MSDDSMEFLEEFGGGVVDVPTGGRCQMRKNQPNRCTAKSTKQYGEAALCSKHFQRIVDLIGKPQAETEIEAEPIS